jgi:hypothetical protein
LVKVFIIDNNNSLGEN